MIYGEHKMGVFGEMYVYATPIVESGGGILAIRIEGPDEFEVLVRADVERLRDLCEEALA